MKVLNIENLGVVGDDFLVCCIGNCCWDDVNDLLNEKQIEQGTEREQIENGEGWGAYEQSINMFEFQHLKTDELKEQLRDGIEISKLIKLLPMETVAKDLLSNTVMIYGEKEGEIMIIETEEELMKILKDNSNLSLNVTELSLSN